MNMKPTVPEIGAVIRLEGDNAVIRMIHEESCKGCGMREIGLCRAGDNSMLVTAKNNLAARVGDTVMIGLDRETKTSGYLLAYLLPLFSLLLGAFIGHLLADRFDFQPLDVLCGFTALVLAVFFSLRRLKRLNDSHLMSVRKVVD